ALSSLRPSPRSTLFPYTTLFRSLVHRRGFEVGIAPQRRRCERVLGDGRPGRGTVAEGLGVQILVPVQDHAQARLIGQVELVDQRSEEHTSELQSRFDLVCRLLLE